MLKGRLGLEGARIPQADRHGLLWLARGKLWVEDGSLRFTTTGGEGEALARGDYSIPFQMVNCLLMGPGSTVSHDALRLLARHGTGLVATGEDGVRHYASMPFGPDDSALARRQARLWADTQTRLRVARRMYAIRLGEVLPERDLNALRGIEGARMRASYQQMAERFGVRWRRRHYDRNRPDAADDVNRAINYAASATLAAAMIATAIVGAIPQLGFIHEDSGYSFALDIADLQRVDVTLTAAFASVARFQQGKERDLERAVRRLTADLLRGRKIIPTMIDHIKTLLEERPDDSGGDA